MIMFELLIKTFKFEHKPLGWVVQLGMRNDEGKKESNESYALDGYDANWQHCSYTLIINGVK